MSKCALAKSLVNLSVIANNSNTDAALCLTKSKAAIRIIFWKCEDISDDFRKPLIYCVTITC